MPRKYFLDLEIALKHHCFYARPLTGDEFEKLMIPV